MTPGLQDGVVEDDAPAKERQRDAAIQRVRVGLTGLAAVFLLTLLAASIFGMLGQDDHAAKLANGVVTSNGTIVPDPPKEPLAELGVAPGGNSPKIAAAPVPAAGTTMATQPPRPSIGTAAPPPARR